MQITELKDDDSAVVIPADSSGEQASDNPNISSCESATKTSLIIVFRNTQYLQDLIAYSLLTLPTDVEAAATVFTLRSIFMAAQSAFSLNQSTQYHKVVGDLNQVRVFYSGLAVQAGYGALNGVALLAVKSALLSLYELNNTADEVANNYLTIIACTLPAHSIYMGCFRLAVANKHLKALVAIQLISAAATFVPACLFYEDGQNFEVFAYGGLLQYSLCAISSLAYLLFQMPMLRQFPSRMFSYVKVLLFGIIYALQTIGEIATLLIMQGLVKAFAGTQAFKAMGLVSSWVLPVITLTVCISLAGLDDMDDLEVQNLRRQALSKLKQIICSISGITIFTAAVFSIFLTDVAGLFLQKSLADRVGILSKLKWYAPLALTALIPDASRILFSMRLAMRKQATLSAIVGLATLYTSLAAGFLFGNITEQFLISFAVTSLLLTTVSALGLGVYVYKNFDKHMQVVQELALEDRQRRQRQTALLEESPVEVAVPIAAGKRAKPRRSLCNWFCSFFRCSSPKEVQLRRSVMHASVSNG